MQVCFVVGGKCDASSPNTEQLELKASGGSAPYSFTGLAAGQYDVLAAKDVDGNGSFSDAGDYTGCYNNGTNCVAVTPPKMGLNVQLEVVGNNGGGGGGTDQCAVELSDDLSVSSVFTNTPSDCDYLITGPVSIENGQFTIEPGVVIKFAQDAYLRVDKNASLDAVGTAASPIRFESMAPVKGYGKGLNIGSGSLVTRLEYVQFLNLGKQDTGAFGGLQNGAIDGLDGGGLSMKHVTISGSVYDGATLDDLPLLAFETTPSPTTPAIRSASWLTR